MLYSAPSRGPVQPRYQTSTDPDCYTALPNLCITPTFLAKLTDTDPVIREHLRHRVWELFSWTPVSLGPPPRPEGFEDLVWAPPLPHQDGMEARMRSLMMRRLKDRTVQIAAQAGWRFSSFRPDQSFILK